MPTTTKLQLFRKWFLRMSALLAIGILMFVFMNAWVRYTTSAYIFEQGEEVPTCYTALVLGAKVYNNGQPSRVLQDRLDNALVLYRKGKVKRFLLSGDHGRKEYDEVKGMRNYLERQGVAQSDIFLDHAGFDTYDSVIRAKAIFEVEDVMIVTQASHLPRAVFIARQKGLKAYGYIADEIRYPGLRYFKARESLAVIKAVKDVLINAKPTFLGAVISIKGDSRKSYD